MYMDPLKKLDYASLSDDQEKRLRELEHTFNDEFKTKFYFMVMEKD
jgi:hypothetical protein